MKPRAAIIARVHLAPTTSRRLATRQQIATFLYAVNVAWLSDVLSRGQIPPMRLLLAEPPWTETRRMVYEPFHGDTPRDRERDYFDGPYAMHVGRATCIEIAAYDAAAISVLEQRAALPVIIGHHPDYHAIVELQDEHRTRIDTTALYVGRAGEQTWPQD